MAVLNVLTSFVHIPNGFTNQSLRDQSADLLGPHHAPYGTSQMSYDLRRLRLIYRSPSGKGIKRP
jgi:hypothetical protein